MKTKTSFSINARDGQARLGVLRLQRGLIDTPAFMPVGTVASVKGIWPQAVAASGAQILLANCYHLILRPGAQRIASLRGLHKFMGWDAPILTDSGGFQIMSLAPLCKIDEEGAMFKSHIDGAEYKMTPESSIETQILLDTDITMAFDECTKFGVTNEQAAASMRLSMRWARRSRTAFGERPGRAIFGIQQGALDRELREESSQCLKEIGFDGYAIGGLAVGEGREAMFSTLDFAAPFLPDKQPRYLMGVGRPADIVGAVSRGVDMFDCVLPTRSGRTGQAFTSTGEINIKNSRYTDDPQPLDSACSCPCCSAFSRAYISHLFRAREMLGPILLTTHNLYYYQSLMQKIREAISLKKLEEFSQKLPDGPSTD